MKYLKNLFAIAFLTIISQKNFAQKLQFENSCWMPKIYLTGIKNGEPKEKLNAAIKPIESILIQRGKIYIKTYKDEFNPSGYKFIEKNKIVLETVMVNLAQPTVGADPVLSKFSKAKFYLYRKGKHSMFLIIKGQSVCDTIQFMKYSKSLQGL